MICSDFANLARNRVTIQSPVASVSATGGRTVTWNDVGTYWAAIYPSSGREAYSQQGIQNQAATKIVIRYKTALKNITSISNYRVVFDDRYYGIVSINNLDVDMKTEGRSYQALYCVENAPDING